MKGCDKLQELIKQYTLLQKYIHNVVQENRCRDGDIDSFDLLEQSEEEFAIELLDFLTELNEKEELSEV